MLKGTQGEMDLKSYAENKIEENNKKLKGAWGIEKDYKLWVYICIYRFLS